MTLPGTLSSSSLVRGGSVVITVTEVSGSALLLVREKRSCKSFGRRSAGRSSTGGRSADHRCASGRYALCRNTYSRNARHRNTGSRIASRTSTGGEPRGEDSVEEMQVAVAVLGPVLVSEEHVPEGFVAELLVAIARMVDALLAVALVTKTLVAEALLADAQDAALSIIKMSVLDFFFRQIKLKGCIKIFIRNKRWNRRAIVRSF